MRRISKLLITSFALGMFVAAQPFASWGNVAITPQQSQVEHGTGVPSQGAGASTPAVMNERAGSVAKSDWPQPMVYQRAGQLMGKTVVDRDNRKVGSIKDLIFDKYGRIDYVILASGGLFGLDANLVPIPWSQVVSEGALAASGPVTLNISKAKLAKAPTLTKAKDTIALHEPDIGTAQFFHKVNSYFGSSGAPKTAMVGTSGAAHNS
jgi:sporulation protein YlmC with PRC-barrel domain